LQRAEGKEAGAMIGIGCLAPIVLFVVGAFAGYLAMGSPGVTWGAGIGFLVGLVMLGAVGWVVGRIKRK
jgi:hypothetical protein